MGLKSSLTPLESVPSIDPDAADRLRQQHITSAEELIGQIYAEPAAIQDVLQVDEPSFDKIRLETERALDPSLLASMASQRERRYKLGARDPDER
jgi:hypothetical protein